MSNSKYIRPASFEHCFGHLVEECGEVVAASGKIMRWGWDSVNPELPEAEQETNIDWLRREMKDLRGALDRMERVMEPPTVAPAPLTIEAEEEPSRDDLLHEARTAANRLLEWCRNNETQWGGYGDQIIPPIATRWTKDTSAALALLSDRPAPPADPNAEADRALGANLRKVLAKTDALNIWISSTGWWKTCIKNRVVELDTLDAAIAALAEDRK